MLTPEIGQLVTGEARSGVPGGVALPAIAPPSSVGSGSIDGAMSDGSYIHSRRHRKDCTSRVSGSSTKEMGIGVSPDHHVPMGSVTRLREYASVPRIIVVSRCS